MRIAIYPGSFDPLTNGHWDIITRASKLFDKVIVAVATSARKAPMFSQETRMAMVKACFQDQPQIDVQALTGLLVDFAKAQQAQFFIARFALCRRL